METLQEKFNPTLTCSLCGHSRPFLESGNVPIMVEGKHLVRLAACGECHNHALTGTPETINIFKNRVGKAMQKMNMLQCYLWYRDVYGERTKHRKGSDDEILHMFSLNMADLACRDQRFFTMRGLLMFARKAKPDITHQGMWELLGNAGLDFNAYEREAMH